MAHIDLADVIENMDQTSLVLALIATNPDLDDILPDDPKLKDDVANIRRKIAERHLSFQDSPWEISSVVERHVHVHLWDKNTNDRLKALGAAVVDIFRIAKERVIAAKSQIFDNDTRETISVEEAYNGIRDSFVGLIHLMTRDIPLKSIRDADRRLVDKQNGEAAIRIASSAVNIVLSDSLRTVVQEKSASTDTDNEPIWESMDADNEPANEPIWESMDADNELESESTKRNDDTLSQGGKFLVRSSTYNSPHYITSKPGINTYTRADAALFSKDEAELLAEDHSNYAASKGYGYRYQIEEADLSAINSLRSAPSPSMSG